MGLFRAFGMAARRWYLLLPLVLAAVGAAYVAYREMPAVYTASVVHQVNGPDPVDAPDSSAAKSDSPNPDSPERTEAPSPEYSYASATTVAGELAAKVQPPRARTPGTPPPYTVTARPDSPLITVRADADSAQRALGTVRGVSARLTAQLATLQDQRAVPADREMRLDTAAPPSVGPPVRTTGIKVFAATLAFGLLLAVVLAAAVERSARRRAELAEGDPDALLDDSAQDDQPEHDHEPSERVSDEAAAGSASADEQHADRPAEEDPRPDGDERPVQVAGKPAAADADGAATGRAAAGDGDDAPTEIGALSAIVAPRIRRPGPPPPGRPVPPSHPGREAPVRDVVPMRRPVPRGGRVPRSAGPPPGQPRSVGARLAAQQRPLPPRRPVAPPPLAPAPPPLAPAPPPVAPAWPPGPARPPAPARPAGSAPPPGARPMPVDGPPAARPPAAQAPPPASLPERPPAAPPPERPPAAPPPARPPTVVPAKLPPRRPGEYHPALINPFGPADNTTFDSSSLWAPATPPLPGSSGFLPATPLPAGASRTGRSAAEPAALETPVSTLAEDDWAEPDQPEVIAPPPAPAEGKASADGAERPRGDDAEDDGFGWSDFDDLAEGTPADDLANGIAADDLANGIAADGRQAGRAAG